LDDRVPLVLLAPDKFKGSLSAADVASALRRGLLARRPDLDVRELPVADGGEGTLQAARAAGFDAVPVTATGPTGAPVLTWYARRGDTAVVELADVSGLSRLAGPPTSHDALHASSFGTGEVLRAALDAGCRHVVLGIGGSACTDGGAGMVQALGARLTDDLDASLPPGGAALARLTSLDLSAMRSALDAARLVVACDVDNPLTGDFGAAAVYAPQKGATADDVRVLDTALSHWADAVAAATGSDRRADPGAGAAGGVGFAALALLGATLRPGIDVVLELLNFASVVRGAALVITGEGALDQQSLRGKAPIGVASAAQRHGVPVTAVCGRRLLSDEDLRGTGIGQVHALLDLQPDPARSMAEAAGLLEVVGARIAAGCPPAGQPAGTGA
jgi:glycerate kinase